MVDAYQTSGRKIFVGNENYLADLSEYANSIDAVGDTRIEKLTVVGSDGVESVPLTLQYTFRIPVMYYGDEPKKLRARVKEVNYATLIYPDTLTHLSMAVVFPGLSVSAPTDSVLSHNLEFAQNMELNNGKPVTGKDRVVEFDLSANGDITLLDNVADLVWLVVTDLTATATPTAKLPGSGNSTITISNIGLYQLGEIATADDDITIAALGANQSIEGYVLVGTPGEID